MASLPDEATAFLLAEETDERCSMAVCTAVRKGSTSIMGLVKGLAEPLTSTEDVPRSHAVLLLAEVVSQCAEALVTPGEVHTLAAFFTARLADWPCVRGALKGCGALAARRGAPALAPDDAVAIAAAFLASVHMRSLAVAERQLSFGLLLALAQGHAEALAAARIDILDGAAAALDGERDPRCLLTAFAAIAALAEAFARAGAAGAEALEGRAEELVDVLACYFPITYAPPTTPGPGVITREQLVGGVAAALAGAPAFAPYALPLILEKLGSSLRHAKLDAMAAAAECARRYGTAALAPHLPPLWAALRNELLPPPAAGPAAAPDEARRAEELAGAAAACLTECVRAAAAAGDAQLVTAVLADELLSELLGHLAPGGAGGEMPRSAQRVVARARVLASVAAGSMEAAQRVCGRVLPAALTAAAPAAAAADPDAARLALSALLPIPILPRRAGRHLLKWPPPAEAAGVAAAALLAKWDSADVDAAVGQALDGALLPRLRLPHSPARLPSALACLGAVAGALAMRAHPRTQDAVLPALAVLEAAAPTAAADAEGHAASLNPAEAAGLVGKRQGLVKATSKSNPNPIPSSASSEVVRAAAGVYEALVSPRCLAGGAVAHAAPRVLWQQRAFAGALQPLLLRLQAGWCLAADGAAVDALLATLGEALQDAGGRALLEEHAGALLGALGRLAVGAPAAATRATALECLLASLALPWAALHPHRAAVLRALAAAADDRKRTPPHIFPFCIVYTPIPLVSWFLPCVGHVGICTSAGLIYDFAGPYFVNSSGHLAFGNPTRYWQADAASRPDAASWDLAVDKAAREFSQLPYNAIFNNCHDFASKALNNAGLCGRWHTARVAALVFLQGRHVGAVTGW
ncbi:hypothetical protein WJX81_002722 [Elliptochloris bilobata]|uniref:MMS19 nucleotide excision repair protein n=1 Tax=Elliptochloris bilobata TaxID=381761 RepID=A0AAW1S5W8_9CHLO